MFEKTIMRDTTFAKFTLKNHQHVDESLINCWDWSGAEECTSCWSRKMLNNEYLLFTCKDRRRYSRERAISKNMKKRITRTPYFERGKGCSLTRWKISMVSVSKRTFAKMLRKSAGKLEQIFQNIWEQSEASTCRRLALSNRRRVDACTRCTQSCFFFLLPSFSPSACSF